MSCIIFFSSQLCCIACMETADLDLRAERSKIKYSIHSLDGEGVFSGVCTTGSSHGIISKQ